MTASSAPRRSSKGRVRAVLERWTPELLLIAMFVALVAPVIAVDAGKTRRLPIEPAARFDENSYHLPTALQLGDELPTPDLEHLGTATTPGYHLVLGVFARLVSDDRAALEAFGALFSLAMVLVAFRLIARYTDRWLAFAMTLPLLLSHYVLQSSVWLNTDNVAVLFILLALGVALEIERSGCGFARGGAFIFLAVWCRQLALWAAGPFVFAAGLAGNLIPGLRRGERRSWRPVVLAAVAVIPAVASLAVLAAVWGQLTPPVFANQSGTSPAAVPFTLAIVGVFGPVFAVCSATRDDLLRGRAPFVAAAVGALLAVAVPTSETNELERRTGGGLWKLVDKTPVVADRSLAIAALAAVGGAVLVALWRAAARSAMQRQAAVVLVAMLSLAAAQAGTVRTYQRYFEPILLVLLALLAAMALQSRPDDRERLSGARLRTIAAMAALAALQLVGCVLVVYDEVL